MAGRVQVPRYVEKASAREEIVTSEAAALQSRIIELSAVSGRIVPGMESRQGGAAFEFSFNELLKVEAHLKDLAEMSGRLEPSARAKDLKEVVGQILRDTARVQNILKPLVTPRFLDPDHAQGFINAASAQCSIVLEHAEHLDNLVKLHILAAAALDVSSESSTGINQAVSRVMSVSPSNSPSTSMEKLNGWTGLIIEEFNKGKFLDAECTLDTIKKDLETLSEVCMTPDQKKKFKSDLRVMKGLLYRGDEEEALQTEERTHTSVYGSLQGEGMRQYQSMEQKVDKMKEEYTLALEGEKSELLPGMRKAYETERDIREYSIRTPYRENIFPDLLRIQRKLNYIINDVDLLLSPVEMTREARVDLNELTIRSSEILETIKNMKPSDGVAYAINQIKSLNGLLEDMKKSCKGINILEKGNPLEDTYVKLTRDLGEIKSILYSESYSNLNSSDLKTARYHRMWVSLNLEFSRFRSQMAAAPAALLSKARISFKNLVAGKKAPAQNDESMNSASSRYHPAQPVHAGDLPPDMA